MTSDCYRVGRRLLVRAIAQAFLAGFLLLSASTLIPGARLWAQEIGSAGAASTSEETSRATVYLPLGHPAYGTIERLRGAGLLPDAWLNQRPLSRLAVAKALLDGVTSARERGMDLLADEVDWRLREFTRDIDLSDLRVSPRKAPLSIHWEGGDDVRLTGEMHFELGYDNREDLPPDYTGAFLVQGGFEVYGTVGREIGYGGRYRQASETREGTIRRWPYAPVQSIAWQGHFGDYVAYNESSGHLSWDGRIIGADICFDSPAWGPSPARNLLLSGHVPSFGYLQGRVGFGDWLRYTVLAGSVKSGIIDSVRSYQPEEPTAFRALERQKYLIGHRLDLHPLSSLHIGLMEACIVADRFPELLYFVPTVSLWGAQHYLRDPDNSMMGLDVSWSPVGGPNLYGGIALDELDPAEIFADSTSHNWIALQLGGSWTPPFHQGRWHIWLEATRVLPNVYRHHYPVNDWTHADSWLGFWSAQNSEVIQGRLTFLASPRLRLAAWGRYARKGGEVSREEQYTIPPSEKFLFGRVRIGAWVGGRLTYEGTGHWVLTAEAVRAPAQLWPHNRMVEIFAPVPASLGQQWQFFLRWTYNPF